MENNYMHHTDDTLQLRRAELRSIQWRLDNFSNYRYYVEATGEDPNTHFKELLAQRNGLLKKINPLNMKPDLFISGKPVTINTPYVGEILERHLFGWQAVTLPSFVEGINQSPVEAGTSGQIYTVSVGAGGVNYSTGGVGDETDAIDDEGTVNPLSPKTWIHTWHCSMQMPDAPGNGYWALRFQPDIQEVLARANVTSGLFANYVTLNATTEKGHDNPMTLYSDFGFFAHLPLPNNGVAITGKALQVNGRYHVSRGEQSSIDIILGVIVQVASGIVEIGPTSHCVIRQVGSQGVTGVGVIEYAFMPAGVIELVHNFADIGNP